MCAEDFAWQSLGASGVGCVGSGKSSLAPKNDDPSLFFQSARSLICISVDWVSVNEVQESGKPISRVVLIGIASQGHNAVKSPPAHSRGFW